MTIDRLCKTVGDENTSEVAVSSTARWQFARLVAFGAQFKGQITIGKLGIIVGDEYTYEAWFISTTSFNS